MKEFQVQVNQSLVDKTLDNFEYDPLEVIRFPNPGLAALEVDPLNADEIVEGLNDNIEAYSKEALELVEEEYFLLDNPGQEILNQPQFLTTDKRELVNPKRLESLLASNNMSQIGLLEAQEQLEDAVSYATDIAAQYVIQYPTIFGPDLVVEAEQVIQRQEQHAFNAVVLGFGGFLKKVWGKVKNAAKKIWNWVRR